MKTHLRFLLLLLAWVALTPTVAKAQVPGASFPCDGKLYQTRQATAGSTTTTLYRVDRTTNPYTTVALRDLGVRLNAVGYNQRDNFLYAVTYANGATNATINLYRIGQSGAQLVGPIKVGASNLPSSNYAGGAIDKDGIMYISTETGSNSLYRIDLNTVTPTQISASIIDLPGTTNYTFYDLAINPVNNNIYGTAFEGTLFRIVPNAAGTNATVTDISSSTAVNGGADPVGTAFFDAAGTLLVASNGSFGGTDSGNFYIVDVTSAARSTWSFITTLPRSAQSDGASCIFPSQKIDVVKSAGLVTRVNATEYTVPYTIIVKNTATEAGVDAANIQVSDFLFRNDASDNVTNITFGTANLPTGGTETTRSVIESLQLTDTDPNTVFTLNNTGTTSFNGTTANDGARAGLLRGNQTLKQGFSITITFMARVRYAGTVPSTAQLNTAIATSSSSINPGYRLDATNGIYIPPIDLLAADQSTNGNTLPLLPNADSPSPTPVNFTGSIAGTVFEDVNYGGGAGRSRVNGSGVGVSGVRVELYTGTNGAFIKATTTDTEGFYSFDVLTEGTTYTVRVVNSTVKSTRDGGTTAGLLAVQTYANASKVGGNFPAGVDPAQQTTGNLSTATQSTLSIAAKVGNPASADFGFNFSTIVNTNASGQGSLSQFIINSNALLNDNTDLATSNDLNQVGLPAGVETSIFMIPSSAGFSNGVAVINQTSALPPITDARTAINGKTQTVGIGNSNATTLGTAGTVGTGATAFNKVAGPEVKISLAATIAGLSITGNSATITGINLIGSNGNALTISGNNATVTDNALGSNATNNDIPGTRTPGSQINITAGSGSIISGNLIAYAGQSGVVVASGATNVLITDNEITTNGLVSVSSDGLTLASSGVRVTNNLITGNAGMGIDLNGSTGSASITGNTIKSNGVGTATAAPTETAGIRVAGSNNSLTGNILESNYGAGILVVSGASSTTISRNSTFGNGTVVAANNAVATNQLGIDLLTSTDDPGKGTSTYVSVNSNNKTAASGANGLLNFPIIYRASTDPGQLNLEVTGYAPKGSTIEFFISDKTTAAFGQGRTYLFTATEGATTGFIDGTARVGNYSGTVNGLDQGSETGASIYVFSIPLTSANFTEAQLMALKSGTTRLTATATLAQGTSEFSGNVQILQGVKPLPVTLVAFGAQAAGLNARLNWKTAQELNNDHFVIERSFDARSFVAVGQVKGQGSTQATTSYVYTDERVANLALAGLVYYRLRQVDTDGMASLSEVQTVRFPLAARAQIDVYPNPAPTLQDTRLDLSGVPVGAYQITLVDMTGRVLRTFSQNGGTVQELQLTNLPAGTYLVRVQGNGQSFSRRVIKQ